MANLFNTYVEKNQQPIVAAKETPYETARRTIAQESAESQEKIDNIINKIVSDKTLASLLFTSKELKARKFISCLWFLTGRIIDLYDKKLTRVASKDRIIIDAFNKYKDEIVEALKNHIANFRRIEDKYRYRMRQEGDILLWVEFNRESTERLLGQVYRAEQRIKELNEEIKMANNLFAPYLEGEQSKFEINASTLESANDLMHAIHKMTDEIQERSGRMDKDFLVKGLIRKLTIDKINDNRLRQRRGLLLSPLSQFLVMMDDEFSRIIGSGSTRVKYIISIFKQFNLKIKKTLDYEYEELARLRLYLHEILERGKLDHLVILKGHEERVNRDTFRILIKSALDELYTETTENTHVYNRLEGHIKSNKEFAHGN